MEACTLPAVSAETEGGTVGTDILGWGCGETLRTAPAERSSPRQQEPEMHKARRGGARAGTREERGGATKLKTPEAPSEAPRATGRIQKPLESTRAEGAEPQKPCFMTNLLLSRRARSKQASYISPSALKPCAPPGFQLVCLQHRMVLSLLGFGSGSTQQCPPPPRLSPARGLEIALHSSPPRLLHGSLAPTFLLPAG